MENSKYFKYKVIAINFHFILLIDLEALTDSGWSFVLRLNFFF